MLSMWNWLRAQVESLPYPQEDCSGRTIIVTGANTGLGLEAARHFVRLNAAKVILACRNLDKGEEAKKSIEESTSRIGVAEVWQLDLASFDSVKEFAARAQQLNRLDILLNNAGLLAPTWELLDGHESQMTVNVISTTLLSILLLPILRRSSKQYNVVPHIVTVSSDGAFASIFPEKKAENIMAALDENKNMLDRYGTSKLLQLMMTRKLAKGVDASGQGHVIVNALHPGVCNTTLFRNYHFLVNILLQLVFFVIGRDAEMGSRTLMGATFGGEETHGNWMSNCKLHVWPGVMKGEEGEKLVNKFWKELLEVLEGIEPEVSKMI